MLSVKEAVESADWLAGRFRPLMVRAASSARARIVTLLVVAGVMLLSLQAGVTYLLYESGMAHDRFMDELKESGRQAELERAVAHVDLCLDEDESGLKAWYCAIAAGEYRSAKRNFPSDHVSTAITRRAYGLMRLELRLLLAAERRRSNPPVTVLGQLHALVSKPVAIAAAAALVLLPLLLVILVLLRFAPSTLDANYAKREAAM